MCHTYILVQNEHRPPSRGDRSVAESPIPVPSETIEKSISSDNFPSEIKC